MSAAKWHKSKAQTLDDGFDSPQEVTGLALAFGGDMAVLLPPMDSIPENFKHHQGDAKSRPWIDWQGEWFFHGVKKDSVKARAGVDRDVAFRHLGAIQGSWEPKHEHKMAAVAWLASRWFEAVQS